MLGLHAALEDAQRHEGGALVPQLQRVLLARPQHALRVEAQRQLHAQVARGALLQGGVLVLQHARRLCGLVLLLAGAHAVAPGVGR